MILPDPDAVAEVAGGVVVDLLRRTPSAVLGLATGSSPLGVYHHVIASGVSLAHASAVLLDEYVGLPAGHPESYRAFIRREFVDHTDLPVDRLHGPDAWVDGPELPNACAAYETLLADLGGVDLQLLGIGADGHLAFNEPSSSLASRTRVKTLTPATRADNARFFGGDPDAVPRHVVTQGLGTILAARHLLLVAAGTGKAAAVAVAVEGPVSASCPASVLQLHPHATVVIDEAAAAALRLGDYYRETYRGKPGWQGL